MAKSMTKYISLFFFVWSMIGCRPTGNSKSILDSFNAADKTLDSISMKGQNESLGAFVKSTSMDSTLIQVEIARKKIESFIDSAKEQLQKQPDEDFNLVNNYFFTKGKGEELFSLMKSYQCEVVMLNPSNIVKSKVDSIFTDFLDVPISKTWSEFYFENTPSVAAITMLNKFEIDIRRVFILVKNGSK